MKVRLREMPCHRSIELSNELVRALLSGLPMRAALDRPDDDPEAGHAKAELELSAEGQTVLARGRVDGWADVACGRCVGQVRIPIQEHISVTFLPRNQVPDDLAIDSEEEVEPTEDDLDLYPYDNDEIDLEPLLREQVLLAVPFAPLCREDCKGLCPVCGNDLNQQECGCDRAPIDPRLAALKDLKA